MLLAEQMDLRRDLSGTAWECFRGYGVMGLPFASGHVLALRRMTGSSIGPPFTSVWHRSPSGQWTFYLDQEPGWSCPRFFGRSLDRVVVGDIELKWEGPMDLSVRIPDARFEWAVRLSSDTTTRAVSAVGRVLPEFFWRKRWILSTLGSVGGRVLDVGQLALTGQAPNRQLFRVAPKLVWRVEATAAMVNGQDLGFMAPLSEQARLGDFWIPNRGIFVFGETRFERLDPRRHSKATTRWTREESVFTHEPDRKISSG